MEPGKIEKVLNDYGRNSALRAFIQGVPYVGAAADNFFILKRDELQRDRIAEFIAELDRQECDITREQLDRVDFCHATLITVAAAARAGRTEKVHMFARLLSNYDRFVSGSIEDDYEETLRVLDDMSLREYHILVLLRGYETQFAQEIAEAQRQQGIPVNVRRWAGGHWDDFVYRLPQLGVPEDDIPGVLVRLRRTGLYDTMQGRESDNNFYGRTTPLFDRLQKSVERHEREHPAPPYPDVKEDTAGRFHHGA